MKLLHSSIPLPRRGFTLVELIVVLAIIALLVALVTPSLARSKSKAQGVVCLTRVKGLNLALRTYLSSFDDHFPINGLIFPKKHVPTMYSDPASATYLTPYAANIPDDWRIEFGALYPFMGGGPLPAGTTLASVAATPLPLTNINIAKGYICPTDMPDLVRTYPGNGDTQLLYLDKSDPNAPRVKEGLPAGASAVYPGYWSYSVNSVTNSLGRFRNRFYADQLPWTDPLRMFNVKAPHDFITFLEEDNNSLFNDEVVDPPAYNLGDTLARRHLGCGSIGFGDGHAEQISEVLFDQVPSAINSDNVQHTEAMSSQFTRMFFPDRGAFATSGQ